MSELSPPQKPGSPAATGSKADAGRLTIPVVEETLSVSRVSEESGGALRVRIVTREETQRVLVTDIVEDLAVERVAVNRFVSERSAPREEDGVVIVPVFETVAVVETRLLLKEEVRIVRRRREVSRVEDVVLSKESPVVERRLAAQGEWRPEPEVSGGRRESDASCGEEASGKPS